MAGDMLHFRLTTLAPIAFSLLVLAGSALPTAAQERQWRHGTSLIGALKYAPGFARFDYVNPNAPKGGTVRMSATGTFDTFNPILPKGNVVTGISLVYDRLMVSSYDEVSAEYGLLAEALSYPDDYSSVTYRLRDNARWHDGKPVTAVDVVWSFNNIVEINPNQRFYYRHVKMAQVTGEREVTFTFDTKGNRELPHIVGQLLVLPKHWWQGTDANGNKRDIRKGLLEPPMGSGPYRIGEFIAGRSVTYHRVPDYWAKDLNIRIGTFNMDKIRFEYFRDTTVEFEAFKGDIYDWRSESTARVWAKSYQFDAVKNGRVIMQMFEEPYRSQGLMIGFIFNLRRPKFADVRVRKAINYAFPFESINKDLFFGQYQRLPSYFSGIELAATGLPKGQELAILETVRDAVPPEVFTKTFANPVSATTGEQRANLRRAHDLLTAAGYARKGKRLVHAKSGEPLDIELLLNGPAFEKIALRFQIALRRLGIALSIRSVDSSQFINRMRARDFDIFYSGWAQSMSPGNEQLSYFGSNAADKPASRNFGGIANPAVDAVIERIILAKDRSELVAASRALDRVLLWNHYLVPGWTLRKERVARWNRFSGPDPLPNYAIGFPEIWWYDTDKAARTGAPK
jgi:microcin C transport system substrate-binding protein